MFAAGVFERTEDEGVAAVVLHVIGQVLAGDVGGAALVRTLDREARAVVLMVLWRNTTEHENKTHSDDKKLIRYGSLRSCMVMLVSFFN